MIWRTNRTGARARFRVSGVRFLAAVFESGFVRNLAAGETAVPGVIGWRVYPRSLELSDPPWREAAADQLVLLASALDDAVTYTVEIEVRRLGTVRLADRSEPRSLERWREASGFYPNPQEGPYGAFVSLSDLQADEGAALEAADPPIHPLSVLLLGDRQVDGQIPERGGFDSFRRESGRLAGGPCRSFLHLAIRRELLDLAPARLPDLVSLAYDGATYRTVSFPLITPERLVFQDLAAWRDGTALHYDTGASVQVEPRLSYPGSATALLRQLTLTEELPAAFTPELLVLAWGADDQLLADPTDQGWVDGVVAGLREVVAAARAAWPACLVAVVTPWQEGPRGVGMTGLPDVDLVDDALALAVAGLADAPYNVPTDEFALIDGKAALARAGLTGTSGRLLSAAQHEALAEAVRPELATLLAPLSTGAPLLAFDDPANSMYL